MQNPARAVISIHGIETRGVWQKDLVPELALQGFVPYALDYEKFGALKLLLRGSLDKQVAWLVDKYDRIRAESKCDRPSVIAHSFGTLQVTRLLQKYDHVVFDKVILAGGIVPLDYPWPDMLEAGRATWVVNDYGGKDIWPKVARHLVPHAGDSGAAAFYNSHRALHQVCHPHHGHSDYFSQGNFRHSWVRTLALDKRSIVDSLHALTGTLERVLGIERALLRCSVLQPTPDARQLEVVPGLHVGDASQRELGLVTPIDAQGHGAARALAFKEMREFRQFASDLGSVRKERGEESPLHKDLKWSISMPIPCGEALDEAAGVLVIDGLAKPRQGALANELMNNQNVFQTLIQVGACLHEAQCNQG